MTDKPPLSNDHIPSSFFSTRDFAEKEKFTVWREALSDVFDIESIGEQTSLNFEASLESHMLGSMLISKTTATSQNFQRNNNNIAKHNADYIMLEIMLQGSHLLQTPNGQQLVAKGDIVIYDMQQEYAFQSQGEFDGTRYQYQDMDFVFPKEHIQPLVPHIEHLHRHVIPNGELLNTLIKNHLLTLYSQLPKMSKEMVATISSCTAEMIAGLLCIAPEVRQISKHKVEKSQLASAYRLIMDNLDNCELDVEFFCRNLKLSKSALYRLCAPYGGIMKMLRVRRLRTAYNILIEPNPPQITQVALQCGYNNIDSFTRAFKKEFSFKPSELVQRSDEMSLLSIQRPDYKDLIASFATKAKNNSETQKNHIK